MHYGSSSHYSSVRRKASKRVMLAFGQSVWHAHRLFKLPCLSSSNCRANCRVRWPWISVFVEFELPCSLLRLSFSNHSIRVQINCQPLSISITKYEIPSTNLQYELLSINCNCRVCHVQISALAKRARCCMLDCRRLYYLLEMLVGDWHCQFFDCWSDAILWLPPNPSTCRLQARE